MNAAGDASARSKRQVILRIAAEEFGRNGFDATKWARIAEPAGIGNTALYHYFESKTHCLFTLLLESNASWLATWSTFLKPDAEPVGAILDAVGAVFDIPAEDATKHRLLLHEQGKLTTFESTGRTGEAQADAVAIARKIEKLWVGYLAAAMESGAIPRQDPVVLAHAIIGLLQSVWGWYRPGGKQRLADLGPAYRGYVRGMLLAGDAGR